MNTFILTKYLLPLMCVIFFHSQSFALTLNIDDDGNLLGANDVIVQGELYDVTFNDGNLQMYTVMPQIIYG